MIFDVIIVVAEFHSESVVEPFVLNTDFIFILALGLNVLITNVGWYIIIGVGSGTGDATLVISHVCTIDRGGVSYNTL